MKYMLAYQAQVVQFLLQFVLVLSTDSVTYS